MPAREPSEAAPPPTSRGNRQNRRYTFPLYPTARQEELLRAWRRAATELWNAAIEQRETLYHSYTLVPRAADGSVWELRYGASVDPAYRPHVRAEATTCPAMARGAAVITPAGELVPSQRRQLGEARHDPDLAVSALAAQVANAVLQRLDEAYMAAFRRLARGEKPGFPRFRSARRNPVGLVFPSVGQSHGLLTCQRDPQARPSTVYLWLSPKGFGALKARCDLPVEEWDVGELSVYERGGRWWGSLVVRREVVPAPERPLLRVMGVDRGITDLAALSTGERSGPLSALAPYEAELKALERKAARQYRANNAGNLDARNRLLPGRKRADSRREAETRRRVARQRMRVADVRKQIAHEIANWILDQADVVIERLVIASMTRSAAGTVESPGRNVAAKAGLNRAILDRGWGQLAQIIRYKAAERGVRVIEVAPQYSSQTCAACGQVDKASRKGKHFICTACGHCDDADVNAARVIRARGLDLLAASAQVAA